MLTFYLFSNRIDFDILKQIFSEISWVIEPRFETKTSQGGGKKMYANGFDMWYGFGMLHSWISCSKNGT